MERTSFIRTLVGRISPPIFGWILAVLFMGSSATAKTLFENPEEPVQQMTVSVRSYFEDGSVERGFGFIVGVDPDNPRMVHIVTPNHVVCHKNLTDNCTPLDSVMLQFYPNTQKLIKATVFNNCRSDTLDLAFLSATAPNDITREHQKIIAHPRMYRRGDTVRYVGKWDGFNAEWYMPSPPPVGLLTDADSLKDTVRAEGLEVLPGTSGAPLFSDSGVVGIITYSQGNSAFLGPSIKAIEKFASRFSLIRYSLDDAGWFSYAPQWYVGLGVGSGSITIEFEPFEGLVDYYDEFDNYLFTIVETIQYEPLDQTGNSGNLRFARGFKNNWLIGVDIDMFWIEGTDDLGNKFDFTFTNLSASLTYYLSNFLYVRGGPAYADVTYELNGKEMDNETGFGYSFGAGAQIKIGQKWRLVPSIAYGQQDLETISTTFTNYMAGLIYVW